jgi:fatty acid desaturase
MEVLVAVARRRSHAHALLTARVVGETAVILVALAGAAVALYSAGSPWWLAPAVAQGFWFQRLYVVGHESAHRKLLPAAPWLNDLLGQAALLPIGVPLRIFRQIHAFHHGCNRLDDHTSALEVFVVPRGAGPLRRAACWITWYAAVFAGGWFLHSLVSIVLFLFLPLSVARRVSPAFRGWRLRDQLASILWFAAAVAAHVGLAWWLGAGAWVAALGVPFAVFAWVYSAQSYIYHYATTRGPAVRFHVRPLRGGLLVRWWLLNLNEHDVHHGDPTIAWYELPHRRTPLPPEHVIAGDPTTFLGGVLHQLRGPEIVERP